MNYPSVCPHLGHLAEEPWTRTTICSLGEVKGCGQATVHVYEQRLWFRRVTSQGLTIRQSVYTVGAI